MNDLWAYNIETFSDAHLENNYLPWLYMNKQSCFSKEC